MIDVVTLNAICGIFPKRDVSGSFRGKIRAVASNPKIAIAIELFLTVK